MIPVPGDFLERDWTLNDSVVFRKTTEQWGGLSNMAAGFPITVGTTRFLTSEALYQAMRFPGRPDVQQMIADQASPMTAKMKSKAFRQSESHPEWASIRAPVMFWCLQLKLAQNWTTFGGLLHSTYPRSIVEESGRDRFWGAVRYGDRLRGSNALGRLLEILRDATDFDGKPPTSVAAPNLGLGLLSLPVPNWESAHQPQAVRQPPHVEHDQLHLDL